jgi:membrane protease YdiL (CAAX protease family)
MAHYERIIGVCYIAVHAILLYFAADAVLRAVGIYFSPLKINLIVFIISAVILLCCLSRYWGASLGGAIKSPFRVIQALILGYAFYFFVRWGINTLIALFSGQSVAAPELAAVFEGIRLDTDVMLVVAIVLSPIAEETMFRGALFGTLRTKSRVAAYIVSALVFSLYRAWPHLAGGNSGAAWVYFLQFLPASMALCWSYEWSGTMITPAILHALMNLISTVSIRVR